MTQSKIPLPSPRGSIQGTRQILTYNWPFYAAALGALGAGRTLLKFGRAPRPVQGVATAAGAVTLFWTVASIAASWWVYDRSSLYKWNWLPDLLPEAPQRWANFHCGLDESTPALHSTFPTENLWIFDIYDSREMTEPAIRRARRLTPPPVAALPARYRDLPLPEAALDVAFVFFSAHEIRSYEGRLAFFKELRRVVRPGGKVVLLEHVRDTANFLAFGPGFLHFFPRSEWLDLAKAADLKVTSESTMTPFVRRWVLEVPHTSTMTEHELDDYEGSP